MNEPGHWFDRIAHDLRGPISPLQTAAWLLKADDGQLDGPRRIELVEIIERQSRRLARMVDELGDWSRAQQGRLLGERAPCELGLLLDLATGAIPGCAVEPEVDADCATRALACDQHRLLQAFKTMIEYASAGAPNKARGCTVTASCDAGWARIDVFGGAAALDPELVRMMLDQPDPAPFDEGLGLRLLLARAILEAHGGSLAATLDPDGQLRLSARLPALA